MNPIYFVFSLNLLNGVSVSGARILLTLYALKLGAPPFALGVLAATFAVFPMLLSWLSGRLSDRFGSRRLLLLGTAGGGLGMLLPTLVPGLPAVFMAGAIFGLASAFFNVPIQNLVGLLSKPHERAKNYSNYNLVGSVGSLFGPLLVGFSIDRSGYALSFSYLVALSLLPVALLAIWGGALPNDRSESAPMGSVRDLLSDPGVRRVLATTSLQHAGEDVLQVYLPVYGHSIGLSASVIGIVLACNSGARIASRLILTRAIAWLKEENVLAYAFFLAAATFVLIPLLRGAPMLALLAFLFGLGMGCGTPITMMLMYNLSAQGRSGEALGLRLTVNQLTRVVGPVAFGFIGSAFGLTPLFWINAFMLGAGGILNRARRRDGAG